MSAVGSARKPDTRVPCPHCSYRAENAGSIPAHLAMAHPEQPISVFVGRRPEDELACIGSNHVPGCDHLRATPASPPLEAGVVLEQIPLDFVDIGTNVRVTLDGIDELTASIAEHGVLQPVKANLVPDGRFRLLWGQRRVLAARAAGLETIPALVDRGEESTERPIEQLVENLHRADLNPIDRATAMRAVVDAGVSQADLARKLGIAPSTVSNDLRVLELDPTVRERIREGEISAAHGKALVGIAPSTQRKLVDEAISQGASAHRMEELVANHKRGEEWSKKREAEQLAAFEASRATLARQIEAMAKKVPHDAPVRIAGGGYGHGGNARALIEALRAAGFTDVGEASGVLVSRPKGDVCDCAAWRVEITYAGTITVSKACTSAAHGDAAWKAQQAADQAGRAFQERVKGRVQELVTEQALELFHRSPDAARILLWIAFDWSLNDWVRDHKGERKKPDAWDEIAALPPGELAVELATYVRRGFTDRYNIKLDWERLARELGVEPEASA